MTADCLNVNAKLLGNLRQRETFIDQTMNGSSSLAPGATGCVLPRLPCFGEDLAEALTTDLFGFQARGRTSFLLRAVVEVDFDPNGDHDDPEATSAFDPSSHR